MNVAFHKGLNDEAQMPNYKISARTTRSFGLRISGFFPISSLVIRHFYSGRLSKILSPSERPSRTSTILLFDSPVLTVRFSGLRSSEVTKTYF